MKKLYLITFLLTSFYTFSSSAGPTGEKVFDPLVNSYLTVVELSKDGNINGRGNPCFRRCRKKYLQYLL